MRHVRRFPRAIGVVGVLTAMAVGLPAGLAGAGMTGLVDPADLGPIGPLIAALPGARHGEETPTRADADAGLPQARSNRSASPAPGEPTAAESSADASPAPTPSPSGSPDQLTPVADPTSDPSSAPEPQDPAPNDAETASPGGTSPAPLPSSPRTDSLAATRSAVLDLTNAERAKAGCGPVRLDDRINAAAQAHSEDMNANNFFDHQGSNGSSFVTRAQAQGYNWPRSENIAVGQRSAQEVVTAWMNSSGHRANILDCSAKAMGLGFVNFYWTQNFGYQ